MEGVGPAQMPLMGSSPLWEAGLILWGIFQGPREPTSVLYHLTEPSLLTGHRQVSYFQAPWPALFSRVPFELS